MTIQYTKDTERFQKYQRVNVTPDFGNAEVARGVAMIVNPNTPLRKDLEAEERERTEAEKEAKEAKKAKAKKSAETKK